MGKISKKENSAINRLCDPQAKRIVKRMLNGRKFDYSQMKYVVMIEIQREYFKSRCAGVVISSKHVLTAAHCFLSHDRECRSKPDLVNGMLSSQKTLTVFVHYGGNCVNVADDGKCPKKDISKKIRAAHIVMPFRYFSTKCKEGDIAIIEVDGEFKDLSANKNYACLPSERTKLQGLLTSAGYGHDPLRPHAREKQLERVWFRKERYCDPTVDAGKDAFCVVEKKQFACKGDSGSGVMQPANDFRDYVMGLLARGLDCQQVHTAFVEERDKDREFRGSVMTNVRKYLGFICYLTGVCEKHLNVHKLKKPRVLIVF